MKNLKLSVLALCVGTFLGGKAFTQVPSYVPTNGLVGWWPFNGNANDESGNGNNGTVNGATLTTDRFGNANKAYSFDGSANFIEVAHSSSLSFTNAITISFWLNSPDYSLNTIQAPERSPIGKQRTNTQGGLDFETVDNIGSCCGAQFYLNNGSGVVQYEDPVAIPINSWINLIGTYDGTSLKLYQNGIFLGMSSGTINLSSITQNLYFGKEGALGGFFKGNIDDIYIWNRALTSQEITDLFNSMNCANDLTITPIVNTIQTGNIANFTATTSDANSTFTWQSDFGQGYQTLNDFGNYSGTNTNALSISNVQLANHNQPIRAISSNTNCSDTSNIATIQIGDTCITNVTDTTFITVTDTNVVTVYDTLLTTVTDTLIINTTLSLPAPNNENTILIYPNPASDHITIDNGNYTAMAGYTIKIENNAGQQVFQSAINQQQFYVDLSTWTGNGLYFVHLIDAQNNTVTVRKIVLQ